MTKEEMFKRLNKVYYRIDEKAISMILRYIMCDGTTQNELHDVSVMVSNLDIHRYRDQSELIYLELRALQAIVNTVFLIGSRDRLIIEREVNNVDESVGAVLDRLNLDMNTLNDKERKYVREYIKEKNEYLKVYQTKDRVSKLLKDISENNEWNISYAKTFEELKVAVSEMLLALSCTGMVTDDNLLSEFYFSNEKCVDLLNATLQKAKKPGAILQSGMRYLNKLLGGGFQSGRLYTFVGPSGKFKSGTLLNLADQIRLYNPQIKPFENGKRRCVLFVSLENSIEETLERIHDMYSEDEKDLSERELDEVISIMKDSGQYTFSDASENEGGIDIIFQYRRNLSISTAHILQMVTDMHSRGYEPIAIVVDYVKRLNCDANIIAKDEKERISHAIKDLKSLAHTLQIPVITAGQMNRVGNAALEEAIRSNRVDVITHGGPSNIGSAWEIMEDSDWVSLINLEYCEYDQKLYLSFLNTKYRSKTKKVGSKLFHQPFTNDRNIRVATDVMLDKPICKLTLAQGLVAQQEANSKISNPPNEVVMHPDLEKAVDEMYSKRREYNVMDDIFNSSKKAQ